MPSRLRWRCGSFWSKVENGARPRYSQHSWRESKAPEATAFFLRMYADAGGATLFVLAILGLVASNAWFDRYGTWILLGTLIVALLLLWRYVHGVRNEEPDYRCPKCFVKYANTN